MYYDVNKVKIAVDRIGGPTKASNILEVSNASIHGWIKARRVTKIDYARRMAELAGMTLQDLRATR